VNKKEAQKNKREDRGRSQSTLFSSSQVFKRTKIVRLGNNIKTLIEKWKEYLPKKK
jgi:hypothetical protein